MLESPCVATKLQFGASRSFRGLRRGPGAGHVTRSAFSRCAHSFSGIESTDSSYAQSDMPEERRRTLRFRFEASAEVSQENTDAKIPVRVTEISINGCFLQMPNPFPQGTTVHVKIFVEGSFFEANGKVVYSQPNNGVGVAFHELKPYFVTVMKKWLLEAMLAKNKPPA